MGDPDADVEDVAQEEAEGDPPEVPVAEEGENPINEP